MILVLQVAEQTTAYLRYNKCIWSKCETFFEVMYLSVADNEAKYHTTE